MRVMCVRKDQKPYSVAAISGAASARFVTGGPTYENTGVAITENTYLEPIVEIEAPFYQMWPALLTETNLPSLSDPGYTARADFGDLPYNSGTQLRWTSADGFDSNKAAFYRSIGESFSYGYLLGPPMTAWVVYRK